MKTDRIREEIVSVCRTAYLKSLTAGWGGNVSVKTENDTFLITPHRKSLGFLFPEDIIEIDREKNVISGMGKSSMETDMHLALYKDKDCGAVVHLHPPGINSLVSLGIPLELETFETHLLLGSSPPVLEQDSPTVTDIDSLLKAFETGNIVFLKNHGIVAVGSDLMEAFALADVAEEAAQLTLNSILLGKHDPDVKSPVQENTDAADPLPVFSEEHMDLIRKLVNEDSEAQKLGEKTDLTVNYAIKELESGRIFNIHFEMGRITEYTDTAEDADFLNAGSRETWIHVFNGRLDPFAATSQKKLRLLKGHIGDLSKWYAPFYRIFALWKKAPVLEIEHG